MARQQGGISLWFTALAGAVVVSAALYFASALLIPLAMALLLSFLLGPLVLRLQRWGAPRVAATITVVVLAFGVIGGLTFVLGQQLVDLAQKLPEYKDNIRLRVDAVRASAGRLDKAVKGIQAVREELAAPPPATTPATTRAITHVAADAPPDAVVAPPAASEAAPLPVRIVAPTPDVFQFVSSTLAPWFSPVAGAMIIVVFTVFMLLRREDLRDRMILLIGHGRLHVTTQALDDAASRISRYLLMQTIINGSYGVVIALGLLVVGIPNAVLWGLMATVLRFVPYVGPLIAMSMPLTVALAHFPATDWRHPLMAGGVFLVTELWSNNIMEPWLYGTSTGISEIAIIVSAVFWTWLWGPAGLVLSTPLTVCLVVMGKYVPQLKWLDILLGDEPVLSPPARVYQRLLAGDAEEAADVLGEAAKTRPLAEVYDTIVVPAIVMAETDRFEGSLDDDRERFVRANLRELVDDVADRSREAEADPKNREVAAAPGVPVTDARTVNVVCLPAYDEADELVAHMLRQVLGPANVPTRVVPVTALVGEMLDRVESERADVVCLTAIPPAAITHTRYLLKRLRARFPDAQVVVAVLGSKLDAPKLRDRIRLEDRDLLVRTVAEAAEHLRELAQAIALQRPAAA